MASLVSPGVSVTVTNESFFIPASATTVPLFFVATADEKTQPDGVTAAAGTYESNTVRTVTSLTQSTQLYGVPNFLKDSSGQPQHGDARNEYGIFALNQFLGIGSLAYVVRANVNLNDSFSSLQTMWDSSMQGAAYVLENLASTYIDQYNTSNGYLPGQGSDIGTFGAITPGSNYAAGVYTNVALTNVSGTGSGARATITVPGSILTLGTVIGGSLYTAGTYAGVALTGGSGTGATANITVAGGVVSSVVIANNGHGYVNGDVLSVLAANVGGTGSGFSVPVATTGSHGVNGLGAITAGANYTVGSYTNISLTTNGAGTGAKADVTVAGGAITTVGTITGGTLYTTGSYTSVPLTSVTGIGTGATADITVAGGAVTVVTIVSTGSGYKVGDVLSATTATIGGTGSGFTVPVTAATSVGVTAVTITASGSGYNVNDVLSAPTSSLGGTGNGLFAVPVASVYDGGVTVVTLTSPGIGYTTTDVLSANTANLGGGVGTGFEVLVATVVSAYKSTLTEAEFVSLADTATQSVFALSSFANSAASFNSDFTASPVPVYPNGFTNPSVGTFLGLGGIAAAWVAGSQGSVAPFTGWTPLEAGTTLLNASDSFKFTTLFLNQTSLGANDSARRVAIVQALAAAINSNTDIRSETYEYNLILCPGYPEVAQELTNLSIDIQEEAMVIADTPFTSTPDSVVTWAATTARQTSTNVAYYYPHGLGTNLDGAVVFVAASGTALRTIAYSDSVSAVHFAPAGTRRGLVTSISDVGYVTGTLGTATTFVPSALNLGQRNNLYKYFTNINPIVAFPNRGIIVWGQKTSAPAASALDRINVARLMMEIKRDLRKNTMPFVFEPNDKLTQDNLKALVDGYLGNLITTRGLYDFATICDGSNNTPERVDANELYIDIALKPVKAAEFIYIPIRIVATGAPLTNA